MQFNITSSLGVCLSEKGFSLDELIYRLDDLFKNKAFPEIMAGILMIFDEWLKVLVMKKARLPFSCGCGGDEVGHSAQGDVKVLLGIRQSGSVFPIGTWTGHETWEEIGRQLERRKVKFPDGSILVRDGELGLAEGLASIATGQQRCQWHVVRDTYHAMWQDGGKKPDIGPVQDRLKRIMAIELPEESFEAVPDEKKDALRTKTEDAEKKMDELIGEVRKGGFEKAGNCLERAKSAMFSYVRRWLALGIACPRASSFIERTMRELGLRLKKMSYGWKETGLNKVSSILLKMFADEDSWQAYWKGRMNLNQAVLLHFRIIRR